jgi:uncharacterized membrane protein YebE (DUF533 family)
VLVSFGFLALHSVKAAKAWKTPETAQAAWAAPEGAKRPSGKIRNDYRLFTKSLVLAREADGRQQEYKVLNDTWELVGDKAVMQQYVEKEVRGFLRRL